MKPRLKNSTWTSWVLTWTRNIGQTAMTEIDLIAREIVSAEMTHPIRVGIDGFCASGKTTLADVLATKIRALGRNSIRVSADDFQNPPENRWQLGARSPEGFLELSCCFDRCLYRSHWLIAYPP